MSKIRLALAYSKYKDSRGNYIDNPNSGVVSGDTTAELYLTFEHVPLGVITVNKATVYIYRKTSSTTNYIYRDSLRDRVYAGSIPVLSGENESLLSVSAHDIDFVDKISISLFGDVSPFLMYGIGFKGRDKGKTCTIYTQQSNYKPYLELDYSVNYKASAKNIKIGHTDITQPTTISWQTDFPQINYEIQVVQGGNVIFSNTGTSAQSISIPSNSLLPDIDAVVKIKVSESILNTTVISADYAEYTFKTSFTYPAIDNLAYVGEFWEKDISVNWRATNQDGYEWEAYYNNQKVNSGAGGKEQSFVIPANTFKGVLPSSIRIRVYRIYAGAKYYSDWKEISLRLKDITATISNLIVAGEYWEDDILFTWQSTDQEQFRIEAWKNNILDKTYTGTTDTRFIIDKNTLEAGTYLFKVFVGYANRFVNSQSKNVTLKNIIPTLENISISGSNIDYNLTLSWESTYQDKLLLEIYKGDTKVGTVNLTTEKSYIITNNTLEAGTYTFKVKVAYTSASGDRWSDFKQLNVTLVESLPSIGALQPDGTILDKNTSIKTWWTSQNQSKYTLEVIGSGYTYTGTTEKEHIIPQGTLQVGTYTLRLTITYVTSTGVEKSIAKESKFIVTGKPNTPTITSNQAFSYSRPVITWDSAEQLGFVCIIEDMNENEMWSSDWQNGLITRIKCMKYLPNGTYKAKVQIMNEFSIKSDFAIQQFTVHANESVDITLSIEDIELGKKLKWTNQDDYYQAFYIIRNDEVIAKSNKLEYYDYTCKHGENVYTIRGVTGNDTYRDSENISTNLKLPYGTLATVSVPMECIDSELQRDDHSTDMSHSINATTIYLNGREHPIVIVGEHITEEYAISFVSTDHNQFIAMCDRGETFIHRDREENVIFLSITNPKLKKDRLGGIYSCTGLRVDYREVIDYD